MIPLLVIRPEPGALATVAAARALGLEAEAAPLFAVAALDWEAPDPALFDAMLVGSANAPRHAGAALAAYAVLPVYAVGQATAEACTAAGLNVVKCGQGGLQSLLGALDPAHRRLLRLAGRERVELEVPAGVSLTERVVYASEALPMPSDLAKRLAAGAVVLLHSAEAARHFAVECDRLGVPRAGLSLAAIGPRVSAAAGEGWRAVAIAEQANDAALLAKARTLCQNTLQSGQ